MDINNKKMTLEDYDILNILGKNISSSIYKVKNKHTGKVLVWRGMHYEGMSDTNKEYFLEKTRQRINKHHPHIIKFHNYIDQEENNILYIVTEYCENGSLKNTIDSCLTGNNRLSEEFVCKIVYQIAFTIKTIDVYNEKLVMKDIFLDEEFNIKLFDFRLDHKKNTLKEAKMCHLGLILYEICTFKAFNKHKYEAELKHIEDIYSHGLLSLVVCLIKDKTDLKKNVDKVLCHPTILLKSAQWLKDNNFIKVEQNEKPSLLKDTKENNTEYNLKLEKLRRKEVSLQVREQQLNERELKLITREKKIVLMERTVKEKCQQAELYLKRSRESKSVGSQSSKSTALIQQKEKLLYENLDSTYVSCGDSILLPTSSKLNINKIIKPAPFTRTLSERRIKFKGHSPLKDIDFNKRRSVKQPKGQKGILVKKNCEWLTCSEDTDKSSVEGSSKHIHNKGKRLFSAKTTYENDNVTTCDMQCNPLTWTEESKKYAFELLRMMSVDKENKENQVLEVKHTNL